MCSSKHCQIIPPHILEELARRGSTACKKTLNDIPRILAKRNNSLNNLLLRTLREDQGERLVYDSRGEYAQRLALARREGENPIADDTVNSAYDASGYVRDYFRDTFGLNSIDDKGLALISNVHYGKNYNNAYWDGDEMTYGDGDGKEFKNFASAIDVVAHELMHGITQFLSNLEYRAQAGALNEHFSDVFGTVVKQKYLKQDLSEADWLIGDTIVTPAFPGKAIRSLKAPGTANDFDLQPAHMDQFYTGSADNYGVHINSGIPNKAFYLCCQELGLDPAALLWFNCLRSLWRTAGFADFLEILLETSKRLSSEGKLPATASATVGRCFSEVGLHSPLA